MYYYNDNNYDKDINLIVISGLVNFGKKDDRQSYMERQKIIKVHKMG